MTRVLNRIDAAEVERLHAELDWYRRREHLLRKCMEADAYSIAGLQAGEALVAWEAQNPKPGAGT